MVQQQNHVSKRNLHGSGWVDVACTNHHVPLPWFLVNPHEMLEVATVALLIGIFMIFIGRPLSVFSLLPFGKKTTFKSRLFVSWVGLRGAVPIIFATYPVVAEVPGADIIFNIVFFM